MNLPAKTHTPIEGLYRIQSDLRQDDRGWFEEFWHEEKFRELGLDFFRPVQSNASFNLRAGVTRGLHAEPWAKLVTVTGGSVFSAWVDLRSGPGFGKVHTAVIEPGTSYLIPKGLANSYQALENETSYVYLVDGFWREGLSYASLDAFDPSLAIPWPISQERAELSPKDQLNPKWNDYVRSAPQERVVVFGDGQVGAALREVFPNAQVVNRAIIDLSNADEKSLSALTEGATVVINAAAFTQVDLAETPRGRLDAMELNHRFPELLARVCRDSSSTLVHVSSDYVFDGLKGDQYSEHDRPNPVSIYGLSKHLGDNAVKSLPSHYIVRPSWIFGQGSNFLATMARLCKQGESPMVVDDQIGRPTSASQLARAIRHLVIGHKDSGVYNVTQSGPSVSWFELAQFVFQALGEDSSRVRRCSSEEFNQGKAVAPRPTNSVLDLTKIQGTGFTPEDWRGQVTLYLEQFRDN